nr:hypothetical protein [uncultured Acetatifactor sp.]
MSMKMLTLLQIGGVLAAYLSVSLLAPGLLLRRKFAGMQTSVRWMAYFMCGNFYIMNLVYLLELLHISYGPTLILGSLLPFAVVAVTRFRKTFTLSLVRGTRRLRLISEGEMGIKTQMYQAGKNLQRMSSGLLGQRMSAYWPDLILALNIVMLVFYIYGSNVLNVYGYCASDIIVHNYWINELGNNNIFVEGIYPFGFHNVIYYLHAVFSIPTFVLLRVFCVVQTLMIHLMLLAFLRAVCKSKYAPYLGMILYTIGGFFSQATYDRFCSSLPQEFGMLFIFPSAYFAIAFFRERGFGIQARSKFNLTMFAISISMTLAVHFYDTIIAGLFCVGIAVGFCFRCLRWSYLRRIVLAGIIGILLAVLPMGAAYMMGAPLEGSLYWGMSVMTSSGEEDTGEEGAKDAEEEAGNAPAGSDEKPAISIRQRLQPVLYKVKVYVACEKDEVLWFMLGSIAALLLLGMLWFMLGRKEYGGTLVSIAVFMLLLVVLQGAVDLGLPQLIEISRCAIYLAYVLGVVWGLAVDAFLFLLFQRKKAIHRASFATLVAACVALAVTGIKTPVKMGGGETNDAVICMSNIYRENRDGGTWTICSADDERQMMRDYGNHYELIDFLREMEDLKSDASITVPTKTVYFFVEKVPLFADNENYGRKISVEGAQSALPKGKDTLSLYAGDARWVVMSRLYFWAQAFRRLYPNEMEVYYETDDFVCYRVQQNEYSLYNFAIDYGYNRTG